MFSTRYMADNYSLQAVLFDSAAFLSWAALLVLASSWAVVAFAAAVLTVVARAVFSVAIVAAFIVAVILTGGWVCRWVK